MDRTNHVVVCTKKSYLQDKAMDKWHVVYWHLVFSRVTAVMQGLLVSQWGKVSLAQGRQAKSSCHGG